MKNFLRFVAALIILAIGIYIGIQYSEYKSNKAINCISNNILNTNTENVADTNTIGSTNTNTNTNTTKSKGNTEKTKNDFIITYEDEEYSAKTKKDVKVGTNKRNIPKIKSESNQKAADNIVLELVKISDKMWEEIKKSLDEYALDREDISEEQNIGVDYIIKDGFKNDKIIVFNIETSGSMGGVGWGSEEGYCFDVKTGKLLKLKDIVEDYSKTQKYILSEMEKHLESEKILDDVKEYVSGENSSLAEKLTEYEDKGIWYFDKDSFIVSMPKYSIGYGAMGIIELKIDIDDFNEYLKDDYKI